MQGQLVVDPIGASPRCSLITLSTFGGRTEWELLAEWTLGPNALRWPMSRSAAYGAGWELGSTTRLLVAIVRFILSGASAPANFLVRFHFSLSTFLPVIQYKPLLWSLLAPITVLFISRSFSVDSCVFFASFLSLAPFIFNYLHHTH